MVGRFVYQKFFSKKFSKSIDKYILECYNTPEVKESATTTGEEKTMMKVTKTTFGMLAANRREKYLASKPMVQRMKKDGTWTKPFVYEYGTAENAVERLESMNPGCKYRLAE